MVVLTLSRRDLGQVMPLADVLPERVDLFTYDLLAMVSQGAKLEASQPEEYHRFIIDYL